MLSSTLWRKTLMAITGLLWIGFVLTHMLGNLLIFAGPRAYNTYSHAITSNPLIYVAEVGLLLLILAHVASGVSLWLRNRRARAGDYAVRSSGPKASPSTASRTMIFSGTFVAAFLVLHIALFRFGSPAPVVYDGIAMHDVHGMVMAALTKPGWALWYVVALVIVGVHLYHGFASAFQTLGVHHPRYTPLIKTLSVVYAVGVSAGFLAIPLYAIALA